MKKEKYFEDLWMYILLQITLVILLESLKTYTFNIGGVSLTYSLFLLPFVFLITNIIAKRYDYKKAVASIAFSGVSLVLYVYLMSFALGERLILTSIGGEFSAYVVSQFVNLTIYLFLLNNTKSPFIIVLLNYIFSLIIYYLLYTLINLSVIVLENYWKGYFITLAIQLVICIIMTIIDKKVKRGREKEK